MRDFGTIGTHLLASALGITKRAIKLCLLIKNQVGTYHCAPSKGRIAPFLSDESELGPTSCKCL